MFGSLIFSSKCNGLRDIVLQEGVLPTQGRQTYPGTKKYSASEAYNCWKSQLEAI